MHRTKPNEMTNKQYLRKFGMVCYDVLLVNLAINQAERVTYNHKLPKLPLSKFMVIHGIPKNALAEMGAGGWNYEFNLSLDSDKLAELVLLFHYNFPWKIKFPSVKRRWLEEFKYSESTFWNIYLARGIELHPDKYQLATNKLRIIASRNFKKNVA